jgi:hypothetical protein
MPQFMLLLHSSRTEGRSAGPADFAKMIQDYRAWAEGLRAEGKLDHSNKLSDDAGRVLRPGKDGAVAVTDGPYAETKEVLGGYYNVIAPDYDAAIVIAKGSPHLKYGGSIEVRKVDFT